MFEKNTANARQLKLIELLEHYDLSQGTSLADKYVGALRALADNENTDRFSQAANSIRTLIIDFAGGDKRLDSHSILSTIMGSPNPAEAVSKAKPIWNERWDFKNGARGALANIDPFFSDISEEDYNELINNLNKLESYFVGTSHRTSFREGEFNSDEFYGLFGQFENYLIGRMKLIVLSNVYKAEEAILAFERHDNIEIFLELAAFIKSSRIIKSYLFNKIALPKWIPHLID
jgi:hypothetical protein